MQQLNLFEIPSYKIDTADYNHILHGSIVEEFEKKFAEYVDAQYACTVDSCTNAITMALLYAKKEEAETAETTRTSEAAKLREVLPILTHPTRGAVVQRAIIETAIGAYGFSQQELSAASDHRLFHMAHDAMMWRMQKGKAKVRKVQGVERTTRAAANAKAKPTRRASQNAQKMAKARKTGSIDDIAASLIVSKSNRRLSARTT